MKTVAFVPIKLNNERLPGKNIRRFSNGAPLITYILDTLLKVKEIDEIYVYCSSESICQYLPTGVKYLKRDTYLDLNTTSFNDVLTSFAEKISADIYVLTHATAPFISCESLKKGIKAVMNDGYDSALSVTKLQEFLWKDGVPYNYNPTMIPRTQDLPILHTETCGMYIYTKRLISIDKRRVGNNPYLVEISKIEAIDINNEDDFILADSVFNLRRL